MINRRSLLLIFLLPAMLLPACRDERTNAPPREFFPSLDDQQRWNPQAETEFYADGRTSRMPVEGTVAFGWSTVADDASRATFLAEDDAVYRGVDTNGAYLSATPVASLVDGSLTEQAITSLIDRGRERFDIYCSACHGKTGLGDGIVGKRWSYPLPSFHAPQYQPGGEKGQDGYIFHTIRNGVPNAPGQMPALKMPAYAERVSVRDAWSIVLYMRALQRSQAGDINSIPEAQRQELLRTRGAVTAPAQEGAPS